jgi:ubiquinone/menaquinone biosynthesis C-methylase UbiE
MREKVIDANIKVHSVMAATYDATEPHFRPENKARVRAKLEQLRASSGPKLLDLGCGTGFVIGIARDLFDEIHGVDITQEMLDRVDLTSGNIELHRCAAESTPFEAGYFDAVSAYSFLHHLADYAAVLREAFRVLRPGGLCYVDLEPNRSFWASIAGAQARTSSLDVKASNIVRREMDSVLATDERVQKEFGIPAEVFNLAEYYKDIKGGIDAGEFREAARNAGFSSCEARFEWFLGQGAVMHQQSFALAESIDSYLQQALPVSEALYKYIQFTLRK